MLSVATGEGRIQENDEEYKELYFKVKAALLENHYQNKNSYGSLWDFYSYWSSSLPSYQNRRDYVRSLYRGVEDDLRTKIALEEQKQSLDYILSNKSGDKPFTLSFEDLHEKVVIKCKSYFDGGDYDTAILNGMKLIETGLREKGGFGNPDIGAKLVEKAFHAKNSPFEMPEDQGERAGWEFLFKGMIQALKNPHSHRFVGISNKTEAFQLLSFISYLLNFIDKLVVKEIADDGIPF